MIKIKSKSREELGKYKESRGNNTALAKINSSHLLTWLVIDTLVKTLRIEFVSYQKIHSARS